METFSPVAEDLKMQQNASQQHAQAIELLPSTRDVPNVHEISRVLQKQCEFLCCHHIFISIVGINCFIYQEARDGIIYSYLNIFSHIRQISEELNGFFSLQVLILPSSLPSISARDLSHSQTKWRIISNFITDFSSTRSKS